MSRVYDIQNYEVTSAWVYIAPNAGSESACTMSRLVEVLDQWHAAHKEQLVRDGFTNLLLTFDTQEEKHAHIGVKYARLDDGTSGAWMMELTTGDIFQIMGYGRVDRKKCVGNINDPEFNGVILFRDRFRYGRFDTRKAEGAA